MTYTRKTIDTWQLWADYGEGLGFEHEATEMNYKEGKECLETYRREAPQYSYKLVKHRERIAE